jgi:hypothetical protein
LNLAKKKIREKKNSRMLRVLLAAVLCVCIASIYANAESSEELSNNNSTTLEVLLRNKRSDGTLIANI